MLKLLETNAPLLKVQSPDSNEAPGYITLASINREITKTHANEATREESAI
jgi:hypothetical protein